MCMYVSEWVKNELCLENLYIFMDLSTEKEKERKGERERFGQKIYTESDWELWAAVTVVQWKNSHSTPATTVL